MLTELQNFEHVQRTPTEKKLVESIFRHSQGDPKTERLLILAACLYDPSWRIQRSGFVRKHMPNIANITSMAGMHAKVGRGKIRESLVRFRNTQREARAFLAERKKQNTPVTLDEISINLAREVICRDWLYLVNDGGRPKTGLPNGRRYNPHWDRAVSYTAYYALWKDENGNRRTTNIPVFDQLYKRIGIFIESGQVGQLGIEQNYDEGYGMPIADKLQQVLAVYNASQQTLGAPERCVPETFTKQPIASVLPEALRRDMPQ